MSHSGFYSIHYRQGVRCGCLQNACLFNIHPDALLKILLSIAPDKKKSLHIIIINQNLKHPISAIHGHSVFVNLELDQAILNIESFCCPPSPRELTLVWVFRIGCTLLMRVIYNQFFETLLHTVSCGVTIAMTQEGLSSSIHCYQEVQLC